MRILRSTLLSWALVAVVGSTAALAQQGQRGPGGAIGGFHLIMMPKIQQDLQMDEGQIAKAKDVANRMNARFTQDMSKLKGLSQDEQMKRAVTLAGPHYDEGMRQLRGFLKPTQVDRFDQILFQQRGPMAMLEPKIAETLQINNEQAQKVAELVAKAKNDQMAAVKAAGSGSRAAAVQVEEIAAVANEQAIEILSPEQKRTWLRIVGKPFRPDFPPATDNATPKAAEKP